MNSIYLQLVCEGDVGDHLAARTVLLVGEPGVVHVQVRLVLGHQVVAVVQVTGVLGEPRVLDGLAVVSQQSDAGEGRALPQGSDEQQERLLCHVHLDEDIELRGRSLAGATLQVDHGAVEVLDGLEDPGERAHALLEPEDHGRPLDGGLGLLVVGHGVLQDDLLLGEPSICGDMNCERRTRFEIRTDVLFNKVILLSVFLQYKL